MLPSQIPVLTRPPVVLRALRHEDAGLVQSVTGQAVGQAGLWLRDLDEGRASTGYWIAAQFRQRGYASAALDAISRWGLSLDGIHRVELYVEPWNQGSWRAAERAGYVREGLLRSWQRVGPERRDMYMYSLLPQDPPASAPYPGGHTG